MNDAVDPDYLILKAARKMFYSFGVYDTVCDKFYNEVIEYLESKGLVEIISVRSNGLRIRAVDK